MESNKKAFVFNFQFLPIHSMREKYCYRKKYKTPISREISFLTLSEHKKVVYGVISDRVSICTVEISVEIFIFGTRTRKNCFRNDVCRSAPLSHSLSPPLSLSISHSLYLSLCGFEQNKTLYHRPIFGICTNLRHLQLLF